MSDSQGLDAKALALFEQSLELPSKERHDWLTEQAGDDAALRDQVLGLLKADVEEGLAIGTGAAIADHLAEGPPPPSHIGAYKIIERIGQGGMGAVYKAERDAGDFEHVVAIKLIKPGLLADSLKARFQNEQQILARFTHPNIARLYDGGETPEGSPYIIMEFIEGASLTDWAGRQRLDLDARLALFKTTCRAVSFAHQNLIVHQDLTPSNVLVTDQGEVKLIDFGIAKPQVNNPDPAAPTGSLASLSFTPGFAAPERFQGAGANTLSDVYSLGRLLEALTEAVERPTEIEAIINRATQAAPEDRYPSVSALVDDIGHFMTDQPVNAMEGGSGYRFGKFVKRNAVAFGTVTIAFAALVGALILTTNLYHAAETARGAADKRFNDVRSLANEMMFDIYEEIDAVPGTLSAKQALAGAAQVYLNDLSVDEAATLELKIEAALGFIRLADIQGSPRMSNTGDLSTALATLEQAEKILATLPEQEDVEVLSALREIAFVRATRELYIEGQTDPATDYLQQAIDYGERALALAPDDLDRQTDVLQSKMEKAISLRWGNDVEGAITLIAEVTAEYETLLDKKPGEPLLLEEYAKALRTSAEFLSLSRAAADAIPFAEKAIAVEKQRGSDRIDGDLRQLRSMAFSYWRLATPLWRTGDFTAAVVNYEQAIRFTEAIVQRDPGNADAARSLASYQGEVAMSLVELKRYDEAERYMQAAREYFQGLYEENPGVGSAQRSMMVVHAQLTIFYQGWGKDIPRCENLAGIIKYRDVMAADGNLNENDRVGIENFVAAQPPCPPDP
ncbi:MAG: protein kinase [Pseudomonadota bacterium]